MRVSPRWALLWAFICPIAVGEPDPSANLDKEARDFLAFMEYLGEWETRDGEWVDPQHFIAEELSTDDATDRVRISPDDVDDATPHFPSGYRPADPWRR